MQLEKGQEFEPWVLRQVQAMELRRVNSKVFIRARDGSSIGKSIGHSEFRRKLKNLNSRLRFSFNEVVTGIHIMKRINIPEKPGVVETEKVHICAMPTQRRFLSIPMDEWYTPDVYYEADAPDIPDEIDERDGQRYLSKGWDRAAIGNVKEMQPMRGWGSVVKLLVAKKVFSMSDAMKTFPNLRFN